MDLRLRVRAAVPAVAIIIRCLAAAVLVCAAAAQASTGPGGPDYLSPDDSLGGFLEPVSQLQSGTASAKPSAQALYRSFDGQSYDLEEYRGHFVSVLVPASGDAGPSFTAEHLEELVDRLDELYSLYREILQLEPKGSGLLKVAFVPQTCSTGCGLLGAKGIEIESSPIVYELIIAELDAGRLESILVHEMVHNFDAFARHLQYLPDHAHAWTDFFQYFAAYRYGRNNLVDEAPDDVFRGPVSAVWKEYIADDSASWTKCVLDGGCEDQGLTPNNTWAMPYYRLESLYGPEAMLRSFEFLSDYVWRYPAPASPAEKEGLRILSLAHGTGVNIACHMKSLKWALPAHVVSELQTRYGRPDPLCDDADQDGFIAVTGDCDETDPARHALGEETGHNGFDDDCDGLIDEEYLVESGFGSGPDPFATPVQVSLPFEVDGSAADRKDNDTFEFSIRSGSRLHVTLCGAEGFKGWAVALDAQGQFLEEGSWYNYQDKQGCSSVTFDFGDRGRGGIAVIPDGVAGDYRLTVGETTDLSPDHSTLLAVVPRELGGVRLQVQDPQGRLQGLGADELEFWISGTDVRRSVPYSSGAAVTLDRASAPQLSDGALYQVRMRLKADGHPLLPFSSGHLFRYRAGAWQLPRVDHAYSGAWFDPAHEGEGFVVEVLDHARALVYWFTYGTDGRQRWMTGVGRIEASRIVVEDLMDSHGGRFGDDFDPDDVLLRPAGSLNISFLGCAEAVANYSIDNVGGSQVLSRLTSVYGHACDGSETPPARDLSGSWYDPSHNGEGFVVQQVSAFEAAVFWFSYDAQGEQAWFFNQGSIDGGRITVPELVRPQGGRFGRSFDPAAVLLEPWGALELQLDCNGGEAAYQSVAAGFSNGTQSLVNLTRLQNSGCP